MSKIEKELKFLKKVIHVNLANVKSSTGKYLETLTKGIDEDTIDIKDNIIKASYWNDIGNFFLRTGSFSDAEKVYNNMIYNIEKKEKILGELNKGLAYYQYGLSKLVQKNYDEGVPYVLDAIQEDIKKVGLDKSKSLYASKFNNEIMVNLTNILDSDYIPQIKKQVSSFPDKSNIFLNKIDESEKMFLYKILVAPKYIKFKDDIYTKNLLFNRLRELCLFFEIMLRKYPNSNGLMLNRLISNAFRSESWFVLYNSNTKRFDNISDFISILNAYIGTIINSEDLFISTIISQTHLLRNYISHYYDQYPNLLSDKTIYENCTDRITYGILYVLNNL